MTDASTPRAPAKPSLAQITQGMLGAPGTTVGGGLYNPTWGSSKELLAQAKPPAPRSLLTQVWDVFRGAPAGLVQLGGTAAQTFFAPLHLAYDAAFNRDDLADIDSFGDFTSQYAPLPDQLVRSAGQTVGNVLNPSRYLDAIEEGNIVGTVLNDVGNLALLGGIAAKGLGAAGSTVKAATLRESVASRLAEGTIGETAASRVLRAADRVESGSGLAGRVSRAGDLERAQRLTRAGNVIRQGAYRLDDIADMPFPAARYVTQKAGDLLAPNVERMVSARLDRPYSIAREGGRIPLSEVMRHAIVGTRAADSRLLSRVTPMGRDFANRVSSDLVDRTLRAQTIVAQAGERADTLARDNNLPTVRKDPTYQRLTSAAVLDTVGSLEQQLRTWADNYRNAPAGPDRDAVLRDVQEQVTRLYEGASASSFIPRPDVVKTLLDERAGLLPNNERAFLDGMRPALREMYLEAEQMGAEGVGGRVITPEEMGSEVMSIEVARQRARLEKQLEANERQMGPAREQARRDERLANVQRAVADAMADAPDLPAIITRVRNAARQDVAVARAEGMVRVAKERVKQLATELNRAVRMGESDLDRRVTELQRARDRYQLLRQKEREALAAYEAARSAPPDTPPGGPAGPTSPQTPSPGGVPPVAPAARAIEPEQPSVAPSPQLAEVATPEPDPTPAAPQQRERPRFKIGNFAKGLLRSSDGRARGFADRESLRSKVTKLTKRRKQLVLPETLGETEALANRLADEYTEVATTLADLQAERRQYGPYIDQLEAELSRIESMTPEQLAEPLEQIRQRVLAEADRRSQELDASFMRATGYPPESKWLDELPTKQRQPGKKNGRPVYRLGWRRTNANGNFLPAGGEWDFLNQLSESDIQFLKRHAERDIVSKGPDILVDHYRAHAREAGLRLTESMTDDDIMREILRVAREHEMLSRLANSTPMSRARLLEGTQPKARTGKPPPGKKQRRVGRVAGRSNDAAFEGLTDVDLADLFSNERGPEVARQQLLADAELQTEGKFERASYYDRPIRALTREHDQLLADLEELNYHQSRLERRQADTGMLFGVDSNTATEVFGAWSDARREVEVDQRRRRNRQKLAGSRTGEAQPSKSTKVPLELRSADAPAAVDTPAAPKLAEAATPARVGQQGASADTPYLADETNIRRELQRNATNRAGDSASFDNLNPENLRAVERMIAEGVQRGVPEVVPVGELRVGDIVTVRPDGYNARRAGVGEQLDEPTMVVSSTAAPQQHKDGVAVRRLMFHSDQSSSPYLLTDEVTRIARSPFEEGIAPRMEGAGGAPPPPTGRTAAAGDGGEPPRPGVAAAKTELDEARGRRKEARKAEQQAAGRVAAADRRDQALRAERDPEFKLAGRYPQERRTSPHAEQGFVDPDTDVGALRDEVSPELAAIDKKATGQELTSRVEAAGQKVVDAEQAVEVKKRSAQAAKAFADLTDSEKAAQYAHRRRRDREGNVKAMSQAERVNRRLGVAEEKARMSAAKLRQIEDRINLTMREIADLPATIARPVQARMRDLVHGRSKSLSLNDQGASGPIKPGDWIELPNGRWGRVEEATESVKLDKAGNVVKDGATGKPMAEFAGWSVDMGGGKFETVAPGEGWRWRPNKGGAIGSLRNQLRRVAPPLGEAYTVEINQWEGLSGEEKRDLAASGAEQFRTELRGRGPIHDTIVQVAKRNNWDPIEVVQQLEALKTDRARVAWLGENAEQLGFTPKDIEALNHSLEIDERITQFEMRVGESHADGSWMDLPIELGRMTEDLDWAPQEYHNARNLVIHRYKDSRVRTLADDALNVAAMPARWRPTAIMARRQIKVMLDEAERLRGEGLHDAARYQLSFAAEIATNIRDLADMGIDPIYVTGGPPAPMGQAVDSLRPRPNRSDYQRKTPYTVLNLEEAQATQLSVMVQRHRNETYRRAEETFGKTLSEIPELDDWLRGFVDENNRYPTSDEFIEAAKAQGWSLIDRGKGLGRTKNVNLAAQLDEELKLANEIHDTAIAAGDEARIQRTRFELEEAQRRRDRAVAVTPKSLREAWGAYDRARNDLDRLTAQDSTTGPFPFGVDPDAVAAAEQRMRQAAAVLAEAEAASMPMLVPDAIAVEMARDATLWDRGMLPGFRTLAKSNRFFKNQVLPLSARWYINNGLGNVLMAAAFGGIGPRALFQQIRALREDFKLTGVGRRSQDAMEAGLLGGKLDVGNVRGARIVQSSLLESQRRGLGLAEFDQAAEARTRAGRVLRAVTDRGYGVNEFMDNVYRSSVYLAKIEKYIVKGARSDIDVVTPEGVQRVAEAALKDTLKAMGDYTNMAPWQRKYLRQIFPWWSWIRHSTIAAMRLPIEHPVRALWLGQLSELANEDNLSGDELAFFGGRWMLGDGRSIPIASLSPLEDPLQNPIFNPPGLIRGIAPLIKIGAVAATGLDLGRISQVTQPPANVKRGAFGQQVADPLIYDPMALAGYAVGQFPMFRNLRDVLEGPAVRYGTGEAIVDRKGNPIPSGKSRVGSLAAIFGIPWPEDVTLSEAEKRKKERVTLGQ